MVGLVNTNMGVSMKKILLSGVFLLVVGLMTANAPAASSSAVTNTKKKGGVQFSPNKSSMSQQELCADHIEKIKESLAKKKEECHKIDGEDHDKKANCHHELAFLQGMLVESSGLCAGAVMELREDGPMCEPGDNIPACFCDDDNRDFCPPTFPD